MTKKKRKTKKPTPKQRLFIDEYLKCLNSTKAAKLAGYKGNQVTLGAVGSENLRKPLIKAEIDKRMEESAMSANEVLVRLGQMARGDLGDFTDVDRLGDLCQHPSSHLVKKLTVEIRKTKKDDTGFVQRTHIELHDAQSALSLLGKRHKLFTDRVEHINYDLSNFTDEQLQRIADGEHPASVMADTSKSET